MTAATVNAAVQQRLWREDDFGRHVHRWEAMGGTTKRCEDWPLCKVMLIDGVVC